MKAIDIKDNLDDFLLDETRRIADEKMKNICLIGEGERTCRYIVLSKIGFVCSKKTPMSETFDDLVNKNKITAKSNNCEGLGSQYEKKEKETKNDT